MLLGLHCDVRPGYQSALRSAQEAGCRSMQILTYRRHHAPTEKDFLPFREARARSEVRRLVLHVRYLPALASSDTARWERSVELLAQEIRWAKGLGGDWLVLHMGAYSPLSDAAVGMILFADGVAEALARSGGGVPLVVENVPGGGRRMGGSLEELAGLLEHLSGRGIRMRACLDTAHAWSYGYDIDSQEGMWRFLGTAHRLLGADSIPVFHLNDSRASNGSHRENHEHWGQGFLGTEGIRELLAREEYRDAAGILEMPLGDFSRDVADLEYLRGLAAAP